MIKIVWKSNISFDICKLFEMCSKHLFRLIKNVYEFLSNLFGFQFTEFYCMFLISCIIRTVLYYLMVVVALISMKNWQNIADICSSTVFYVYIFVFLFFSSSSFILPRTKLPCHENVSCVKNKDKLLVR